MWITIVAVSCLSLICITSLYKVFCISRYIRCVSIVISLPVVIVLAITNIVIRMGTVEQLGLLFELGTKLGYSGETLDNWAQKQINAEHDRKTSEAQIDLERLRLAEKTRSDDMELEKLRLQLRLEESKHNVTRSHDSPGLGILGKIPKFEEGRDNLDSFIRRFETVARSTNVPESQWGTQLLVLIGGRGLDACQSLTEHQMKEFKILKQTLLEYYHLTEDGYRQKFRHLKPSNSDD